MWSRWTFLQLWLQIHRLTKAAAVVPAPIDVGSSQFWDGDDGEWSSFPIRVGTPAQNVRILVSTAATNTWVIQNPAGCEGWALPGCADTRGVLFSPNKSITWEANGPFGLAVEQNLGLDAPGVFGFDTVGLGWQGSGGPTVDHTVVAQINSPYYVLGRLGLNPRPTNFSTFNDPQTSYLSLLYEKNEIPSLSYSYSAGAKYRNNGVLGTLTLGGYKEGISEVNDLNFPFYFDQTRDLTIGIQSITATIGNKKTPLLSSGILSFIDSTVTQIWLPKASCDLFASTFGLRYDNDTNLYFLNGTQHAKLVSANPSITFTIGLTAESGGKTADITFPYAAFDLNITYPTVSPSTYYFPIRRATNETQFTLGRAFLQEAYLTVDYLRNNFSVSQRTWDTSQQTQIVPIPGLSNETETSSNNGTTTYNGGGSTKNSSNKGGISTGAITGIAIVAVVLIAAAIGLFFFLRIRKRRAAERETMIATAAVAATLQEDKDHQEGHGQASGLTEIYSPPIKPPELQGDYYDGHEAPGDQPHLELPAAAVHRRGELAAHDVDEDMHGDGESTLHMNRQNSVNITNEIYELEAPHGMVEMSNLNLSNPENRPTRWGSTSSPVSAFSSPVSASSSVSRISRKPVAASPNPSPRKGSRMSLRRERERDETPPPPPLPKDYI